MSLHPKIFQCRKDLFFLKHFSGIFHKNRYGHTFVILTHFTGLQAIFISHSTPLHIFRIISWNKIHYIPLITNYFTISYPSGGYNKLLVNVSRAHKAAQTVWPKKNKSLLQKILRTIRILWGRPRNKKSAFCHWGGVLRLRQWK